MFYARWTALHQPDNIPCSWKAWACFDSDCHLSFSSHIQVCRMQTKPFVKLMGQVRFQYKALPSNAMGLNLLTRDRTTAWERCMSESHLGTCKPSLFFFLLMSVCVFFLFALSCFLWPKMSACWKITALWYSKICWDHKLILKSSKHLHKFHLAHLSIFISLIRSVGEGGGLEARGGAPTQAPTQNTSRLAGLHVQGRCASF